MTQLANPIKANETLSYTFGLYANATVDGYLYIFGRTNSSTGMRLARVPTAQMTQRSSVGACFLYCETVLTSIEVHFLDGSNVV